METEPKWKLYPANRFDEFRGAWDQLNSTDNNSPLLDSRFVSLLLRFFGDGDQLLAVCGPMDQPVALAVISHTGPGVWSTFQPSQAPLGLWVQSSRYRFSTLAGSLIGGLPGFAVLLGVQQQDPSIRNRLEMEGAAGIKTMDYMQTGRVPLAGSFDDFWNSRGRNLRHNLHRQRNRLEREGVKLGFDVITAPSATGEAVRAYAGLESSGWKSSLGQALEVDNVQGRFYREVLRAYGLTGQAMVFQLRYGQRVVASDMCITGGDTMVMLKTTYDERIKTSSPAMLLHQEAFAYLFAHGQMARLEFYGRLMDWHRRLTDDIRTMFHANVYRFPWMARLHL